MVIKYAQIKDFIPAQVGEQVRINHTDCSAGADTRRRLYIKRTLHNILCYCHNCGSHLALNRKGAHLTKGELDALVHNFENRRVVDSTIALPDDCQRDPDNWPDQARNWLYQYELEKMDIIGQGIVYSPTLGRVILPVYKDIVLVYWQGRSVDGVEPKYIAMKGTTKPVFLAGKGENKHVVIVEDIVSAIKLAKAGHIDALALLGTHEPTDILTHLAPYIRVWIWLDPDTAGRQKAVELTQRLSLLCADKTITQVKHPDLIKFQPKEAPLSTIRRLTWV